jgi:predicted ATPase/Tfp pilus assembly protein PilF
MSRKLARHAVDVGVAAAVLAAGFAVTSPIVVAILAGAAPAVAIAALGGSSVVLQGIGTELAASLTDRASTWCRDRLLSEDGLLNHDLQEAMRRAFMRAATQLEALWWETPRGGQIWSGPRSGKDPIKGMFKTLQEDANRVLNGSRFRELIGDADVLRQLDENQGSIDQSLNQYLSGTLHGHEDELVKFVKKNFVPTLACCFAEELKAQTVAGSRAWRAYQRLALDGILEGVSSLQAGQSITLAGLAELKVTLDAIEQRLQTLPNATRDPVGEQGLQDAIKTESDRVVDALSEQFKQSHGEMAALLARARDEIVNTIHEGAEQTQTVVIEVGRQMHVAIFEAEERLGARIDGASLGSVEKRTSVGLQIRRRGPFAPPTPLFGRDEDVAAVCKMIRKGRLVTLEGPPGVGKTRLALEVADRLSDQFANEVAFVNLRSITEPEDVAVEIARELGVREVEGEDLRDSLLHALESRQLLLLLDNFEQVLPAAELIGDLIDRCPVLRIVVTSRTRLKLRNHGEQPFSVEPLPTLEPNVGTSIDKLREMPSFNLYVDVATRVAPKKFTLTEENATFISMICQRLDGLPGAIELAAATVRAISPRDFLERMQRRLPMLDGAGPAYPGHHSSMRNSIAWSYDLLSPHEQAAFRIASVFQGPFSLSAIEHVSLVDSGLRPQIVKVIQSLVDQHLVIYIPSNRGDAMYTMLPVIRDYAEDLLNETNWQQAALNARRQHALWYRGLASRAAKATKTARDTLFVQFDKEHDNIRLALRWFQDQGKYENLLEMSEHLSIFWLHFGPYDEGLRWLMLGLDQAPDASDRLRARALERAAFLTRVRGELDRATTLYEQALLLYRTKLPDRLREAHVLHGLGVIALKREQFEKAKELFEDSIRLHQQFNHDSGVAYALGNLAQIAFEQGDHERAIEQYKESYALHLKTGDMRGQAYSLGNLGTIMRTLGDYQAAEQLFRQDLELERQTGERAGQAVALFNLGELARDRGDHEGARNRLKESLDQYVQLGDHDSEAQIRTMLESLDSE